LFNKSLKIAASEASDVCYDMYYKFF